MRQVKAQLPDNKKAASPVLGAEGKAGIRVQWVLALGAAFVVVALLVAVGMADGHIFNLRFNPYAIFSILAVASNICAFVLLTRLKTRTDGLRWFALHLFALALWAVAETFIRLSATPEGAVFWSAARSVGAYLMPVAFFMFALSYTNHRQARHPLVLVPLLVVTLLLLFFDHRTDIFNHYDPTQLLDTPWGYMVTPGSYYIVVVSWLLLITFSSMVLFYLFHRRTHEPHLRHQAELFMLAILIPLVGGSITDGIAPILGFTNVMPLAVMLTAAMGMIISYGIVKYSFFKFDPTLVAEDILAAMNEAVIGIRPDLTINYANPGAERLLGYSAQQFSKLSLASFLSQSWHAAVLKKALVGSLTEHQFGNFDSVDLRTATDTIVRAKLSISKIMEGGRLQGYLVVMTDITDLAQSAEIIENRVKERTREVQEARATLVTSINSLKLGFIITNEEPEVIMVNTVAHDIFCKQSHNHTASECQEVRLATIQAELGDSMGLTENIQTCLKRQLPHERKNVSFNRRDWRVYVSPMVIGRESIGTAVLFQDTTQERLLERSRDEFFSIASHELRTPLTSIKGNSSLIIQYYQKLLKDPDLREMVEDIHESSNRLIEIVNDFLDVSRLEQGRIEFHLEELPVAKVVEDVVYGMNALITQKGLHLRLSSNLRQLDVLPMVIVDKNRLKQVLFNLFGNATKFTTKGSISVEATIEAHDMIKIRVIDTGPGIAEESQGLLFRKFQQARENILTRDASQSTGLGLYISRLLAEGMGGTLELEKSVLGKGSTFAVTLPIATPIRRKKLEEITAAAETAMPKK